MSNFKIYNKICLIFKTILKMIKMIFLANSAIVLNLKTLDPSFCSLNAQGPHKIMFCPHSLINTYKYCAHTGSRYSYFFGKLRSPFAAVVQNNVVCSCLLKKQRKKTPLVSFVCFCSFIMSETFSKAVLTTDSHGVQDKKTGHALCVWARLA